MAEGFIDPSHIEAAQRFVEEEVGPRRHLTGAIGKITSALAVGMSLVFLYWAWATSPRKCCGWFSLAWR